MKRHVSNGLSEALLEGFIDDGDTVRIELADDETGLTFERVLSGTEEAADSAEAGGDGAATVDA
jgi:ATP-dependent Clp protease ATP-binding subunit ClpB